MRNPTSLIADIRNGEWFCRIVASITVFAVLWISVFPSLLAAQELATASSTNSASLDRVEGQLNRNLAELAVAVRALSDTKISAATKRELWETIAELEDKIRQADTEVNSRFEEIGALIDEHDLPEVIMERHSAVVSGYRSRLQSVFDALEDVRNETNNRKQRQKATDTANRFEAIKKKASSQAFDPNQLPSRSIPPNPENTPKTTALEFVLADPFGDGRRLRADIDGTPPSGNDAFSNPDWLSESVEVQITQAIADKALELQNDPVQIYHWVRNNIEWNPNWGAKQSAELTLELRSGNAMDIASLTIALMRASGIPARYVHGTIDLDEERFRNWAGGFADVQSGMDFASSGAMRVGALISGGTIAGVRLEHVWVEVAVDYIPSRAARNISADSWIAIDPSFKQFEYLDGIDVVEISNFDTNQLLQDFSDSGTRDDAEGWFTGFDTGVLEAAQADVQVAVEDYVNVNIPDPTVGDIIGGRRTIVQDFPNLSAELPYSVVVATSKYASLPQNLQQRITFALKSRVIGIPVRQRTFAWAEVNNRKITLAFPGATAGDEAAVAAFLPTGQLSDLSEVPVNIPAYLISVVPELRLDGDVIMAGDVLSLGEEIDLGFNVEIPNVGTVPNEYTVVAGSYLNITAISNNASSAVVDKLQQRIDEKEAIFATGDVSQIAALGDERILGDQFYAASLTYYGQVATLSRVMAQKQHMRYELVAGLGSVGYIPEPRYLLGIPLELRPGGVVSDRPFIVSIAANLPGASTADVAIAKRAMTLSAGMLSSALEHLVPEQLFPVQPGTTPEGISTVKAFQKALSAGQRLYEISPDNLNSAIAALNLDAETVANISAAVNSGKHVVVHTDPVSVPGWSGAGYLVFDPVTGDGAYLISGGANGGFIFYLLNAIVLYIVTALAIFLALTNPALLALIGVSFAGGFSLGTDFLNIVDNCSGIELVTTLLIFISVAIMSIVAPGPGIVIGALIMASLVAALTALVPKPEYAC